MANERMMRAIGRMELALERLETVDALLPAADPQSLDYPGRARAVEALKSLDSLIADLKTRG